MEGVLGGSCWQADEPTSQLVRPAVAAATTPGPNHTLLWVSCACAWLRIHTVVNAYACVRLTSGKAWEILPSGGSLAPKP